MVIRGNGTVTRDEVGLDGGGGLGAFDREKVDSVVVPGVSVVGGGGWPTVFEGEYCGSVVTIGNPEV